jgi:hypothetical protein
MIALVRGASTGSRQREWKMRDIAIRVFPYVVNTVKYYDANIGSRKPDQIKHFIVGLGILEIQGRGRATRYVLRVRA